MLRIGDAPHPLLNWVGCFVALRAS